MRLSETTMHLQLFALIAAFSLGTSAALMSAQCVAQCTGEQLPAQLNCGHIQMISQENRDCLVNSCGQDVVNQCRLQKIKRREESVNDEDNGEVRDNKDLEEVGQRDGLQAGRAYRRGLEVEDDGHRGTTEIKETSNINRADSEEGFKILDGRKGGHHRGGFHLPWQSHKRSGEDEDEKELKSSRRHGHGRGHGRKPSGGQRWHWPWEHNHRD
ncbi:hypothetical protein CYLTODRAFT_486541 [Cylindrobasidium torrendii FP15055 ss-10]|uniref:Extracellular membrane protein CFEM domain-containing protein n=1 Tax=Cylindrobasidium torrendii FP15055 ss-10 TaxID=1314674 RepID=A0A0D7BPK0_9AGAR|nr:hypothetical protein CYLTODRAFT_486541 [Cylindrobasidium torrendii FP15055 ss-10]